MKLPRLFRSITACLLAVLLLGGSAAGASGSSSADVVAAALGEVGAVEEDNEYTKYGEWYGIPNGYWCDMFVSWCAMTAGVPSSRFPRDCSCTDHVRRFIQMGLYEESASRGNTYIPRQGDEIFFYNYDRYPDGTVKNHTGLVLYTEDGYVYTIEGNALSNRLDLPYSTVSELEDGALDPPDYVTVNRYPLDDPRIHGYGVPAYDDRTPLALEGFVDLGRYAENAAVFQSLSDSGVMPGTSSHTFSPNHGMTRAEFTALVTNLFGLSGWTAGTPCFTDVMPGTEYYSAIMSACSAGLLDAGDEFRPDSYIGPGDAQAILDRGMAYIGMKEQTFTFSLGDLGYIEPAYTTRADIAMALDAICRELPMTEAFEGKLLLNGVEQDWEARLIDGLCCVPVEVLCEAFPRLKLPEAASGALEESEEPPDGQPERPLFPAPLENRAISTRVVLQNGEICWNVPGVVWRGTQYISLAEAARLLSLVMEEPEPGVIVLNII